MASGSAKRNSLQQHLLLFPSFYHSLPLPLFLFFLITMFIFLLPPSSSVFCNYLLLLLLLLLLLSIFFLSSPILFFRSPQPPPYLCFPLLSSPFLSFLLFSFPHFRPLHCFSPWFDSRRCTQTVPQQGSSVDLPVATSDNLIIYSSPPTTNVHRGEVVRCLMPTALPLHRLNFRLICMP